jgi:hypothetical protein
MSNLWCLEKNSILPLVISATGIVPQSLFKNLKILDLDNTLVSEIQKGILLLNFGFLCTKNASNIRINMSRFSKKYVKYILPLNNLCIFMYFISMVLR